MFEFVDRSLFDMVKMENITGTHQSGFKLFYFYAIKANGVNIVSLAEAGPGFACKPDML